MAARKSEPESRGINWKGVFIVLMLCSILFVGCTGVVGYVGLQIYDRVTATEKDTDKPKPSDHDDHLAESIQDAGVSALHAVYFSKVCTGVANRLEVDRESKQPIFDQRKEAVDLVGNVGSLAVAGNDAANYRKLPGVIEEAFEEVWESDDDGKLKAGPLTAADHKEVVRRWRDLASAFKEVAN